MNLDDLEARRVARASLDVAHQLEAGGSVVRLRAEWPGTTEQWTAAAAAAEERLQRPVASGLGRTTGTVWATLLDWPRTADELLSAARRNHELTARMAGVAVPSEPPAGTAAGRTAT